MTKDIIQEAWLSRDDRGVVTLHVQGLSLSLDLPAVGAGVQVPPGHSFTQVGVPMNLLQSLCGFLQNDPNGDGTMQPRERAAWDEERGRLFYAVRALLSPQASSEPLPATVQVF